MCDGVTSPDDTVRVDVAIVGAGPTGETLAALLSRCGRSVALLEAQPTPYVLPRAIHYDHEVARILAAAGIDETQQAAISEPGSNYDWVNADRQLLLRFSRDAIGRAGWPAANYFSQPQLEALLRQRNTDDVRVQVLRGWRVTGVVDCDDDARVTAYNAAGASLEVEAAFVIGADGARSFVREHLGFEVVDQGYFFDWLILDLIMHTDRVWDPPSLQVCDPRRPVSVVPGGPGRRRFEVMLLDGESSETLLDPLWVWEFLASWDIGPNDAELERTAVYRFQARWAKAWRSGRVLLAGDAAHQMPPFAGQGMCSGIRDAANLAWKLDLVLAGFSSIDLLDTYGEERSAHVQNAIGQSVALGHVICITDPAAAAERDRRMLAEGPDPARALPPIPPPQLRCGVLHSDRDGVQPMAGILALQGRVRVGGRTGRWDDVVGTGWALIAREEPKLSERDSDLLAGLGTHVGWLDGPRAFDDVDGRFTAGLDEQGAAAVVVRPDHYVYGAIEDLADLPAMLEDLRANLCWIAAT